MRCRLIVVSSLFALSGCGSSSAEDSEVSSSAEPTTVAETTSTTEPTTTTVAESDIDAFCAIAIEADDADTAFVAFDDPAAVEAYFTEQLELLEQAIAVVPVDVRADYEAVQATGERINETLATNDYDFASSLAELSTFVEEDDYVAALERTDQFEFDECGIELDAAASDASEEMTEEAMSDAEVETILAAIETEAGRAVFVQGVADESGMTIDEASCFVDNIDVASFLQMSAEPTTEQMTQVLEAFDVCAIDPSLLTG